MKNLLKRLVVGAVGVLAGGASTYVLAVRPWHLRWGATQEEVSRHLPGDDLVPNPKINATHAISINASAAEIWPWLVQMGADRGGFYSYDWIENLMGLGIHSADRIVPEFQNLQVGDNIALAPGFGIPVAAMEPGRVLLLHGDTRSGVSTVPILKPGDFFNSSWVFLLDERSDGTTRLIERFRTDYNPSLSGAFFNRVILEPGSFLMERKMLLGIKKRVEHEVRRENRG